MKTKSWTPPPAPSAAPVAAPVSPKQALMTPIYLVSDATNGQPQEYEIVSACYQAWRHLRDRIPFKLTLKDGFVLAAFQNGELMVDDAFKTAFVVFDNVMALEVKQAVTNTMNVINSEIAKRSAEQRLHEDQQAEVAARAAHELSHANEGAPFTPDTRMATPARQTLDLNADVPLRSSEPLEEPMAQPEARSAAPSVMQTSAAPLADVTAEDAPRPADKPKSGAADVLSALTSNLGRRRR